jgi:riboflavin transporter FmnP
MNPLKKLLHNTHGSMVGGIIALVVGLATVVVATMVILLVTGTLSGYSAATNYGSAANNATAATLFTNTFQAVSLMTILPIIMVAGVIIAAVGGFLMWYRGKG